MLDIDQPSPNFDLRAPGTRPQFIILHYTGTQTADEARSVYLNNSPDPSFGRVSTHYMIDLDGTITRHVDEDKRAWHAGKSYWQGFSDLNSWSIGIEVVNAGHLHGLPLFPSEQIEALAKLCKTILSRYGMGLFDVLAHSDIAVTRKIDPGENFPWEKLAELGVGFWPKPNTSDELAAKDALGIEELAQAMLTRMGYDPDLPFTEIVTAFQRRYHPEIFKESGSVGIMDEITLARLICLYHALPDKEEASVGRMTAPRNG